MLEQVLAGREERYRIQSALLQDADFVCQISLNIPGYPKSLPGEEHAISCAFQQMQIKLDALSLKTIAFENGAGKAVLFSLRCEKGGDRIKKCAIAVENGFSWGRLLDIDIRSHHKILSRRDLGQPPRSCFFCGNPAFECSREQRHPMESLRREAERLLVLASESLSSLSPLVFTPTQ